MRGHRETRPRRRLAAARTLETLRAGDSERSAAEGRSRRRSRSRRRGRRRPGPEGDRVGQRKIASAHCCRACSGAAPSPARWVLRSLLRALLRARGGGALRGSGLQLTGMGGVGPPTWIGGSPGFSSLTVGTRGQEGGAGCAQGDCAFAANLGRPVYSLPLLGKGRCEPRGRLFLHLQSRKVPGTCAPPLCVHTACSLSGRRPTLGSDSLRGAREAGAAILRSSPRSGAGTPAAGQPDPGSG